MPHKNTVRQYTTGSYYHVYNRGVEKRTIFDQPKDYKIFTSILIDYLTPKPPFNPAIITRYTPYWRQKLSADEVWLICYCLMPNHFHLILRQQTLDGITRFMRRISNAYVRYFNQKYHRVGALFQGKFKAARIDTDQYLLHLTRYIHLNPSELEVGPLDAYPYSSYPEFIGKRHASWLKSQPILDYFSKSGTNATNTPPHRLYQAFVEQNQENSALILEDLAIDQA
jgi:putative transposase